MHRFDHQGCRQIDLRIGHFGSHRLRLALGNRRRNQTQG
jgi:hypothetical protein